MQAIGYVRVSTEDQASEGVSLKAQRAKLTAYAILHGIELVAVLADEGLSGKRIDNRPALQEALRRVRGGEASALIVAKLDRLSRSTRDVLDLAAECERGRWQLHSIAEKLDTGSAMGRFVLTIMAGLATMERELISERTSDALMHKRRTGQKAGGSVPYGRRLEGGAWVVDETERAVLQRMVGLRAEGLGCRRIANALNADGVPAKRGGKWSDQQVQRALKHAETEGLAA